MKNSIITLAIIFMMAGYTGTLGQDSQAVAQKPDVPEVAPEFDIKIEDVAKSYAVGDLIEIDAVVTGANGKVKYDWKVRPEVNFKIWSDGSKILFGTGPKPTNFKINGHQIDNAHNQRDKPESNESSKKAEQHTLKQKLKHDEIVFCSQGFLNTYDPRSFFY